jgi:hypothetical protein
MEPPHPYHHVRYRQFPGIDSGGSGQKSRSGGHFERRQERVTVGPRGEESALGVASGQGESRPADVQKCGAGAGAGAEAEAEAGRYGRPGRDCPRIS